MRIVVHRHLRARLEIATMNKRRRYKAKARRRFALALKRVIAVITFEVIDLLENAGKAKAEIDREYLENWSAMK